jgi:hypothetical protein
MERKTGVHDKQDKSDSIKIIDLKFIKQFKIINIYFYILNNKVNI